MGAANTKKKSSPHDPLPPPISDKRPYGGPGRPGYDGNGRKMAPDYDEPDFDPVLETQTTPVEPWHNGGTWLKEFYFTMYENLKMIEQLDEWDLEPVYGIDYSNDPNGCPVGTNGRLEMPIIQVLAGYLKRNVKMKSLSFKHCNLGDNGAIEIAKSLTTNSNMTSLDLQYNLITSKCVRELSEILWANNSLCDVKFAESPDVENEFAQVVHSFHETITTRNSNKRKH
jgi:hypothetical protein